MGDFLSGTTAAATEFSESWELLRDIVQGSGVSGPLDSEVASAGRGVGQHLAMGAGSVVRELINS